MERYQFSFGQALVLVAVIAAWGLMVLTLGTDPNLSPGVVLFVLFGLTFAVHHLTRSRRNSWLISAAIAPLIAIAALLVAFALQ